MSWRQIARDLTYDPTDHGQGMPRIDTDYRLPWWGYAILVLVFVYFTSAFWLTLLGILWTLARA